MIVIIPRPDPSASTDNLWPGTTDPSASIVACSMFNQQPQTHAFSQQPKIREHRNLQPATLTRLLARTTFIQQYQTYQLAWTIFSQQHQPGSAISTVNLQPTSPDPSASTDNLQPTTQDPSASTNNLQPATPDPSANTAIFNQLP